MPAPILLPRPLASADATAETEAFFDEVGITSRRPIYRQHLHIQSTSLAVGIMPRTRAAEFELARDEGYHTRSSAYKALDKGDATKAHADTMVHRDRALRWVGRQGVELCAVTAVEHDRAICVKGFAGVSAGFLPFATASTRHYDDPFSAICNDARRIDARLPLVTVTEDPLSLEVALAGSAGAWFDHFGVVDPLYKGSTSGLARLAVAGPADADELGIADAIHRLGTIVGTGARVLQVRAEVPGVDSKRWAPYLAFGPSAAPECRYFLQRCLPEGLTRTWKLLLKRAAAFAGTDVDPLGWPVEQRYIRPNSFNSAFRSQHLWTLGSMFALQSGYWPQEGRELQRWRRTHNAWSSTERPEVRSAL